MTAGPARLDAAVDRLRAAYDAAGLPPVVAPEAVDPVLAEIAAAVAPLRVPDDVLRFWRLVDPASVTVGPYPQLTTPAIALEAWRRHAEDPGMVPQILFPVAYENRGFLLVELEDGRGHGGPLLAWDYEGEGFEPYLPGLADHLDVIAATAAGESPHVERGPTIAGEVHAWPEHWRRADGITPRSTAPRGATTTVAELRAAAAKGAGAAGTIVARVVRLHGSGGDNLATVDDGTGELVVWCAAKVRGRPVIRTTVELDVVLTDRPADAPPPATDHLLRIIHAREDPKAMQAAARELFRVTCEAEADAVAKAVRRVE